MSNKIDDGSVWELTKAICSFIGNNLLRYLIMTMIFWGVFCCIRQTSIIVRQLLA